MLALATGRSQLPVARGCSQEKGGTSISILRAFHLCFSCTFHPLHCHFCFTVTPSQSPGDENPEAGCR